MGLFPTITFVISALLLTSFTALALGHDDQAIVTEAAAPLPSHHHGSVVVPPSLAPSHHQHHHHSQSPMAEPPSHHPHHHPKGHNHSHPAPPSHAPVHPPAHSPVHPPIKPPVHPPVKPPVHPPLNPPVHPVKPPVHPPHTLPKRNFVAVQGVVYCKSCKFRGVSTLLGASPLSGAAVKLQCNNTKWGVVTRATTDKNGYFLIKAPKTITTYGAHKCKASLAASPLKTCNQPTDLHGGLSGSMLWLEKRVASDAPFALYTVGPFAFEPSKTVNCTTTS